MINPCCVPAYSRTPSLMLILLVPVFSRSREQLAPACRGLTIPARLETTKIIPRSLSTPLERDLRAESAALLRADRADFTEGRRLQSFFGVVFEHQSGIENLLKI